jgi:hypothetical protein
MESQLAAKFAISVMMPQLQGQTSVPTHEMARHGRTIPFTLSMGSPHDLRWPLPPEGQERSHGWLHLPRGGYAARRPNQAAGGCGEHFGFELLAVLELTLKVDLRTMNSEAVTAGLRSQKQRKEELRRCPHRCFGEEDLR